MNNLDLLCAEAGGNLIKSLETKKAEKKKIENLITKSLGVLQENGIYAFFLFLNASNEGKIAGEIVRQCNNLLRRKEIKLIHNEDVLAAVRDELAKDIDNLFLAKELLEKTLIYARYHAKAIPEQKGK